MERPTPWPYCSANAASSSGNPNSCAVGQSRDDVGGGGARLHDRDRGVHVLAAAGVGVAHRRARGPDREAAVVAGAVAEVAVQDVEERRVAGPDDAVAVDVRVRRAAFAGDRVHALDVLAAEVVEHLADQADALVLADARAQERVELVVRRVHHRAGLGEQADLVGGLDPPGLEEDLLAVDDVDALGPERGQDRHLDQVDAERLVLQAVLAQHGRDLAGDLLGDAGVGVEGAAQGGDAGPGALGAVEPRVEQLVVLGRGAEVPEHRARRRGAGRRTGSACPSPRCRCGWRSGSGCSRSRR